MNVIMSLDWKTVSTDPTIVEAEIEDDFLRVISTPRGYDLFAVADGVELALGNFPTLALAKVAADEFIGDS